MSKITKIIHVQLFPLMSGVQKVSLDELSQLDSNYYDRIVVCKCAGEFTDKLQSLGIRVHFIPELERNISPWRDLLAFLALKKFFKAEKPDIVHTHSSKTGILGRFSARAAKVHFIVHTVHGFSFPGEPRKIIRNLFKLLEWIAGKFTDKLIVLNVDDEIIAVNSLAIPKENIALLPNGVDISTYSPANCVRRLQLRNYIYNITNNEHIIIGMIGRLWHQKNPQCFVRAAIRVAKQRNNVSFFLIGDGEFRFELENQITSSNFSNRIIIMGWRCDVPELLKGLDVMVLPSRWEGMPLAILEAMSTGVTVVASNIPGNRDLICDQNDGRLFTADDDLALAEVLIDLIDTPAKRSLFSTRSRNKVLSSYSLSNRMKKIIEIYSESVKVSH